METLLTTLVLTIVGIGFGSFIHIRDSAKRRNDHREKENRRQEEDRIRRIRDHQLNHGRRVYNWLERQLQKYEGLGFTLTKIEENGGAFSIHIEWVCDLAGYHVLQLSYDFVKYAAPYQGHIHYGAHGADALILVIDRNPFWGLDRFVLDEVEREAEKIKELRAARAAQ